MFAHFVIVVYRFEPAVFNRWLWGLSPRLSGFGVATCCEPISRTAPKGRPLFLDSRWFTSWSHGPGAIPKCHSSCHSENLEYGCVGWERNSSVYSYDPAVRPHGGGNYHILRCIWARRADSLWMREWSRFLQPGNASALRSVHVEFIPSSSFICNYQFACDLWPNGRDCEWIENRRPSISHSYVQYNHIQAYSSILNHTQWRMWEWLIHRTPRALSFIIQRRRRLAPI